MSQTYTLSAQKRDSAVKNSARAARAAKRVPAVVYGHGVDPISVSIDNSDMLRTYRTAGQSSLIDLDIDGKQTKVLIHVLDRHPVQDTIQHVDFFAVNPKEKTTVSVPFNFVGESPAVKNFGGIFMRDHDSIDIRCLPTEIPQSLDVDISALKDLHDHITIKDLGLDAEKFEVMHLDEDTVICSVTGRATETEESEATEGEAAEGEEGGESSEGGEDSSGE